MTQTSIRYIPDQDRYCLTWRTPTMAASAFWYFTTRQEAEQAQSRMSTPVMPERAPVGMLAVRVGNDPWTCIPLK